MMMCVCAQALGLLEEMERRGVSADLVTYNTAIDAVGKAGQHERALGLLREVEKRGTTSIHHRDDENPHPHPSHASPYFVKKDTARRTQSQSFASVGIRPTPHMFREVGGCPATVLLQGSCAVLMLPLHGLPP